MNKEALKIVEQDIESIIEQVGAKAFSELAGRRILITGPSGLMAAYIVDTIAYLNHHVLSAPCKIVGLGRSTVATESRLGHLLGTPHIELYRWDIRQEPPSVGLFEYMIHAAGRSAPAIFAADPVGTVQVNIAALLWILDRAREQKSLRTVFFSSGETYGNPPPEHIPTPETYAGNTQPLGPRGMYTEAKRCGEALCLAYTKQYDVPTQILRPFLVYGPGLDARSDKRVMAEFIRQGLTGTPIILKDGGEALRTYCYITDAMVLFWKIFFSDYTGEAFNIGGDIKDVTSIKLLAHAVHHLCGIEPYPQVGKQADSALSSAPSVVMPDMTKAVRLFDYAPRVSLHEGLKRTIAWNRELGG